LHWTNGNATVRLRKWSDAAGTRDLEGLYPTNGERGGGPAVRLLKASPTMVDVALIRSQKGDDRAFDLVNARELFQIGRFGSDAKS